MHKARRSQCKQWWNDDGRDGILAAMAWLESVTELKDSLRARLHLSRWPRRERQIQDRRISGEPRQV